MNPRHQLPMTQTQTKESFTATKKKSNEILKEFERVIRKRMRGELKGVNVKPSRAFTGWIKRKADFECFDRTKEFEAIVKEICDNENHREELPKFNETRAMGIIREMQDEGDDFAALIVPGLWAYHYPGYSQFVRDAFKRAGVANSFVSLLNSEGRVEENAQYLRDEIREISRSYDKKVVLIGHSKGGLDIAAALSIYEEDLKDIVRAFVAVQSPYGGSPIAEDLLSTQFLRTGVHIALETAFGEKRKSEAIRAMVKPVEDLTYKARIRFLKQNPLPERFKKNTVCFHSKTTAKDSAMTTIAQYSINQYNEPGDGLVLCSDAEINGTRVVRYEHEFDHVDPAFPPIEIANLEQLADEHRLRYAKENERRKEIGNAMLLPTALGVKGSALTSQVLSQPGRVKHDSASVHFALVLLALVDQ